jgi:hypothetical protein
MSDEHAVSEREVRADNDNRKREPMTSATSAPPPKPLTGRQKWNKARPTKMIAFWLCVASIALAVFVGFTWGGWVTGSTAAKQSSTAAQGAVVQRLATICVAQFTLSLDHAQKLSELQAVKSSYDKATFVTEQGWATMPGEVKSDSKVADQCAKQLVLLASN